MPKPGTRLHRKVARLSRTLNVELPHAFGLVCALFDIAADQCPDGDVTKLCRNPRELAEEMRTEIQPELLIAGLASAGWLDELPDGGYYVHDWHEHAEDRVHLRLARAGKPFANGATSKRARPGVLKPAADAEIEAVAKRLRRR